MIFTQTPKNWGKNLEIWFSNFGVHTFSSSESVEVFFVKTPFGLASRKVEKDVRKQEKVCQNLNCLHHDNFWFNYLEDENNLWVFSAFIWPLLYMDSTFGWLIVNVCTVTLIVAC